MGVADFGAIVFDEVFFHGVAKLARIKAFMRRHALAGDGAARRFYAAGDPFQNQPIEELEAADRRAYYTDAVSALFPYQLTLRVCKRVASAAGQARLEALRDDLFVRRLSPSAVLRAHAKPVRDMGGVRGTAICYLNRTAEAVNLHLHARAVAGRADLFAVGGRSYHPGLQLVCRERLHAGNGGVRHVQLRPIMSGNLIAGCKRHEVVVTLGIASGGKGNCSEGTRLKGVGWVVVFKNLDVGPKLNAHLVVFWVGSARDNACRAHGV
jgi:hypothetical protein